MISQTLGEDEYGNPVATITVSGWQDIYRLQINMMHAQIEFGSLARKCFVWMRKRMGAKKFDEFDRSLGGSQVVRLGWHRTIEEEYR
ncbi:MAG TPA: hypothetical protein VFC19_49430 [Candidatus Limnocylindrales bacterium]|nr:hypothetical protein [Candidatus Limnocylindrales bacterium]